ncbi:hypothetical protein WUBG_15403, partial [Wuchereria bancrofti]
VDDQTMKAIEREGVGRRSVTYKGHFQWPSKNSILTTPERKRSRRSTSFADSIPKISLIFSNIDLKRIEY